MKGLGRIEIKRWVMFCCKKKALIYLKRMSVSKKRSKVRSVRLEDQLVAIKDYEDEFSDFNNLSALSSKVFQEIMKKLSHRMTFQAQYLSIKRNFAYFFKKANSLKYTNNCCD